MLLQLTTAPKITKIIGKVGGVYVGQKQKYTRLIRCPVFIGAEALKKTFGKGKVLPSLKFSASIWVTHRA